MLKRSDGSSLSPQKAIRVRNVIALACAVDAADKALLPAVFKALSNEMNIGPKELSALAFAQSIAFSLALPVWGTLMLDIRPRELLAMGCFMWGTATFILSCSSSYWFHFVLRLVIGAALAVVNPVGQTMICDIVPEHERGWAFGLMQSVCGVLSMITSFVTTTFAAERYYTFTGWRIAYTVVAGMSILVGFMVIHFVPASVGESAGGSGMRSGPGDWLIEQRRAIKLAFGKPSFLIILAQGITGAIPWNAFAFLTFYLQLKGCTDVQAGQVMLLGGFGGIIGALVGGMLGDRFHRWFPWKGRCMVAQVSVFLGMVFFVAFIDLPCDEHGYKWLGFASFWFHFVAGWTPAAALRPICADIVHNPQDRAQILALWIALEGTFASVFGAPLVGKLSESFGYPMSDHSNNGLPAGDQIETSRVALRSALLGVSMIPWTLCLMSWFPMYWTYERDAIRARSN